MPPEFVCNMPGMVLEDVSFPIFIECITAEHVQSKKPDLVNLRNYTHFLIQRRIGFT